MHRFFASWAEVTLITHHVISHFAASSAFLAEFYDKDQRTPPINNQLRPHWDLVFFSNLHQQHLISNRSNCIFHPGNFKHSREKGLVDHNTRNFEFVITLPT